MLDAQTGVAIISNLFAQAEATRQEITAAWFWSESSRDAELGAVRMIEDTQIAVQRDTLEDVLNGVKSQQSWMDGAQRAQDSLAALKHYKADATVESVLVGTVKATATDISTGTQAIVSGALSFTWSALPPVAKVGIAVAGVAVLIFFGSKAIGIAKFAGVKGAA